MHQVDDEQLQGAKDAFQVALSKAAGMRFLNINLIEVWCKYPQYIYILENKCIALA